MAFKEDGDGLVTLAPVSLNAPVIPSTFSAWEVQGGGGGVGYPADAGFLLISIHCQLQFR